MLLGHLNVSGFASKSLLVLISVYLALGDIEGIFKQTKKTP